MEMSYIGEIAMRLGAATLVAAGVGLDRELRHKPAGLKTHALVGLGSALIVVVAAALSNMTHPDTAAMSRVIQGLIAGVGFLVGLAIGEVVDACVATRRSDRREKGRVRGL